MAAPVLFDSHVHLADPKLAPFLGQVKDRHDEIGLAKAVVIGTSPEDWTRVAELCQSDQRYLPAIGLHPWKVGDAPSDWKKQFSAAIGAGVRIVGEIGLDQWIEGHDLNAQIDAFCFQFEIAAQRDLPTSIHCLKAHEPLLATLRERAIPARGFKLHAYNGPLDTISRFLDLGAYFSFNAGQLRPNAKRIRDIIRSIPNERILIETDAPDFLPSSALCEFSFGEKNPSLNHPANLLSAYRAIASIRAQEQGEFRLLIKKNALRYFTEGVFQSQMD